MQRTKAAARSISFAIFLPSSSAYLKEILRCSFFLFFEREREKDCCGELLTSICFLVLRSFFSPKTRSQKTKKKKKKKSYCGRSQDAKSWKRLLSSGLPRNSLSSQECQKIKGSPVFFCLCLLLCSLRRRRVGIEKEREVLWVSSSFCFIPSFLRLR